MIVIMYIEKIRARRARKCLEGNFFPLAKSFKKALPCRTGDDNMLSLEYEAISGNHKIPGILVRERNKTRGCQKMIARGGSKIEGQQRNRNRVESGGDPKLGGGNNGISWVAPQRYRYRYLT